MPTTWRTRCVSDEIEDVVIAGKVTKFPPPPPPAKQKTEKQPHPLHLCKNKNKTKTQFATSVGSHTLKLKWAIVIAAIMETLGAILLGGSVSSTISGGVAKPDAFKSTPDVFAYGMLCALSAAAIWLLVATYLELPVSLSLFRGRPGAPDFESF